MVMMVVKEAPSEEVVMMVMVVEASVEKMMMMVMVVILCHFKLGTVLLAKGGVRSF